ncbi:HNH endonuclease, partial [Vibrio cholerae]
MFEVGSIYNRRSEIHGVYKGQQYGGIATPA